MTKLRSRKLHICPKVIKMGSIIGLGIDYNAIMGLGLRETSGTYPANQTQVAPPPPPSLIIQEAENWRCHGWEGSKNQKKNDQFLPPSPVQYWIVKEEFIV